MNTAADLMNAIADKQSAKVLESFDKLVSTKALEKLNEKRQEVARNLFKGGEKQ